MKGTVIFIDSSNLQNEIVNMLVDKLNEDVVVILKGGNLHKYYILNLLPLLPPSDFKSVVETLATTPSDVDVECILNRPTGPEELTGLAEKVFAACKEIREPIENTYFRKDIDKVKQCIQGTIERERIN